MDAKVLYEISFEIRTGWLILPLMLVAFFYIAIQKAKDAQKKKTGEVIAGTTMGVLGAVAVILVLVFVLPDQIKMYDSTVGAYKRGEYQITEGYVEDFHPMPKSGHDVESFILGGVPFEYSSYTDAYGYRQAAVDGGVITGDGQHLRIGYTNYSWLGNVIVYIEELP